MGILTLSRPLKLSPGVSILFVSASRLSYQVLLGRPCFLPPCLTDSKDGQIVVFHLCSNLCSLSSFKQHPEVTCSDGNYGPGWIMAISLWGFPDESGFHPQASSCLQLEIHLLPRPRCSLNSLFAFLLHLRFYTNSLLAHCIALNLEDQGAYFSLAPTPQTCSAWLDLPGIQDSHWYNSGGHWGTQAIPPLQVVCTGWWFVISQQQHMQYWKE